MARHPSKAEQIGLSMLATIAGPAAPPSWEEEAAAGLPQPTLPNGDIDIDTIEGHSSAPCDDHVDATRMVAEPVRPTGSRQEDASASASASASAEMSPAIADYVTKRIETMENTFFTRMNSRVTLREEENRNPTQDLIGVERRTYALESNRAETSRQVQDLYDEIGETNRLKTCRINPTNYLNCTMATLPRTIGWMRSTNNMGSTPNASML